MTSYSRKQDILGLLGWLALTFATSAVGARASILAKTFYGQLTQPEWAPPSWLFGPVWTALYAMMAIAAWLVWRSGGFQANRAALTLFVTQLTLNALWSWLFFEWHLGALAFAEIILLWVAICATLVAFWRVQKPAGILLAPYLAWVTFAAALNYTLWHLNPGSFG